MKKKSFFQTSPIFALLLIISCLWLIVLSCNNQDDIKDRIIERQRQQIDSLSAVLTEKQVDKKVNNVNTENRLPSNELKTPRHNKFLIARLTCQALIAEDKFDLPNNTRIRESEEARVLQEQREPKFHEIVYASKTVTYYSGIKQIERFDEDKKFRFLDEAVVNLKRKNDNVQKVLKRECLTFNSYSEASEYLAREEVKQ